MAAVKGQVLTNFMTNFSPRAMSPNQESLASAPKADERLGGKSIGIQSAQDDHEVIKELL